MTDETFRRHVEEYRQATNTLIEHMLEKEQLMSGMINDLITILDEMIKCLPGDLQAHPNVIYARNMIQQTRKVVM